MVEIVRKFRDGLMLYLHSYTDDISSAEECMQVAFKKLAIKKPNFNGKSSFKTWIYTIGRNIAVNRKRRLSCF